VGTAKTQHRAFGARRMLHRHDVRHELIRRSGRSRGRKVGTFRYGLLAAGVPVLSGRWARAGGRIARGLQFAADGCLVASVDIQGQYGRAMEITELPPTPLVLPAAGELVHIRTQEWALERWDGEDPPGLSVT